MRFNINWVAKASQKQMLFTSFETLRDGREVSIDDVLSGVTLDYGRVSATSDFCAGHRDLCRLRR